MFKTDLLNRARQYQDMVLDAKKTCSIFAKDKSELCSRVQIPLGFIWLTLKLLSADRIEEAHYQLIKAKIEVIDFINWVDRHIQCTDKKVVLLKQKVV